MRFGLLANTRITDLEDLLKPLLQYLEDQPGVQLVFEEELGSSLGRGGVPVEDIDADMLITLGGDGTILRAFQSCDIPLFAIHAGQVGFLTSVPLEEALEGLKKVIAGEYRIVEKLRLKVVLNGERLPDCTNEATIHTSQIAKIRQYSVEVDGEEVANFRSDGLLVSTPTGSTSYAMSVGGPILAPGVQAFIVTPISPYKLSARPYVLPADSKITVRLGDEGRPSLLVLDGQREVEITHSDVVAFTRSEKASRLVMFGRDFFRRVNARLAH